MTFENVDDATATNILPPAFTQSIYFQIADDVRAEGNFYHFNVTTDLGKYKISSIAMLRIRLHEFVTLAELIPRLQDTDFTLNRSPEGRRGVESEYLVDIFSDPLGTASQLFGNLRYNLDKTLTEQVDTADPELPMSQNPDYLDPGPHKRSAAAQIRVDVYSSNPQIQDLLEVLGKARSGGRLRDSIAPLHPDKFLPPAFGSGVFEARLKSFLKNSSAADVNAEVDRRLTTLKVSKPVRVRLLTHPAYTPRNRLYLASYLSLIDSVDNLSGIVAAATEAATEGDAVAFVNYTRMLAFYHLSARKLDSVLIRSGYPSVRTRDGYIVIALPVDYLAWTENTAFILEFIESLQSEPDTSGVVVLLAGAPSPRAREIFDGHKVQIKQHFSF